MFETRRCQNQDVGVGNLERSESVGVENFGKVRVGVGHFISNSATLMKTLDIHEDLVGLYETGSTKAETITKLIEAFVCRLGLDVNDSRGQGYFTANFLAFWVV